MLWGHKIKQIVLLGYAHLLIVKMKIRTSIVINRHLVFCVDKSNVNVQSPSLFNNHFNKIIDSNSDVLHIMLSLMCHTMPDPILQRNRHLNNDILPATREENTPTWLTGNCSLLNMRSILLWRLFYTYIICTYIWHGVIVLENSVLCYIEDVLCVNYNLSVMFCSSNLHKEVHIEHWPKSQISACKGYPVPGYNPAQSFCCPEFLNVIWLIGP